MWDISAASLRGGLGRARAGLGRLVRGGDRAFRIAVVAALTAHLLVAWIAAGGLAAIWPGLADAFGRPPPIGDKAGAVDGVSAEVIDAAEFDKRYIAFKAGRDAADSDTKPPPQPVEQEQKPEPKPEPQKEAAKEPPKPDDPEPGIEPPAPKPEQQVKPEKKEKPLTEAEAAALVASTMEDLQAGVIAIARPGQGRQGEASPYMRSVIRILKQTMPRRAGVRGTVVVRFLINDAGRVGEIGVVRSSGRPDLDKLVVNRLLATPLVAPPANAPARDRMFQITYEYD